MLMPIPVVWFMDDIVEGGKDVKVLHNENLSSYTTLKIGGNCTNLFFPSTVNELANLQKEYPHAPILGGGSNLLINDAHSFETVICLREFMKDTIEINQDKVYVSSGVRLQKLIRYINENGLGGIEYLWSVPGLVGGAIYMNAGRGRGANKQISDYLISVDVLENGGLKTYPKKECGFSYRESIFKNKKDAIIVSAVFSFERITPEEGERRRKERIELCKTFQDSRYPNAGTTFCLADPRVMDLMKKLSNQKSKCGIHFSSKTTNWIQNRGNGTFADAQRLINRVTWIHKILRKPCKLEYKVWE